MVKKIAVLPGDFIGPEVMAQAVKVLNQISIKYHHQFELKTGLIGGAAYEQYKNHLPKETLILCQKSDAILFGSVGGPVNEQTNPKWQGVEKNCLLPLRKHFDLFCNLRPALSYPALAKFSPVKLKNTALDIMIIRELTGGIYFGRHQTKISKKEITATDSMIYKDWEIKRILEVAFQIALKRNRKLTLVDKANVLDCSLLWRKVANQLKKDYPEILLEFMYVDNAAMQLVKNPEQFDVIVTENMFGDILSDLTSTFAGSIGLCPSASLNSAGFGLYEPIGGSAPDIAGQGIANPLAQILSVALMLKYSFNLEKESQAITEAVKKTLQDQIRTRDIYEEGCQLVTTSEMGEAVLANL